MMIPLLGRALASGSGTITPREILLAQTITRMVVSEVWCLLRTSGSIRPMPPWRACGRGGPYGAIHEAHTSTPLMHTDYMSRGALSSDGPGRVRKLRTIMKAGEDWLTHKFDVVFPYLRPHDVPLI